MLTLALLPTLVLRGECANFAWLNVVEQTRYCCRACRSIGFAVVHLFHTQTTTSIASFILAAKNKGLNTKSVNVDCNTVDLMTRIHRNENTREI